jgi:hypothetical protein
MPLVIPQLDDRSYNDIFQEALTRISVHNPQWTNFNDSDPGVTLLQLFSFMQENLLYRCNLIPERNRLKFLTLLGVTLTPASAAHGVVTIANERGPRQTVTLPPNLPMSAGQVGFVTQNGLDVLPVEMQVYYRKALDPTAQAQAQTTFAQLYTSFTTDPSSLDFYQTVQLTAPTNPAAIPSVNLSDNTTVDGSLWLALLTRSGEAALSLNVLSDIRGKTITLGIMPTIDDASRVLFPGGTSTAAPEPTLSFAIATGSPSPLYTDLKSSADGDPLQDLTLVQLTIPSTGSIGKWPNLAPLEDGVGDYPPSLDDPDVVNRLITWIRISVQPAGSNVPSSLNARLSWVGINAARVTQQIQVIAEPLGTGTGEPDQTFQLVNTPVIPNTVQFAVNGELWTRVDDLMAAPPEVPVRDPSLPPTASMPAFPIPTPKVFTVDGESGVITCGTGLNGARPIAGAAVVASYAYGGGTAGNVGIGAIQSSPRLPSGFTVENPLPTWGGDQGESVDDAQRNIPQYLKNGGRAVTAADFKNIVNQTPGISIGRVDVLPLFSPDENMAAPGAVTLMVIPESGYAPEPDLMFLDAICTYLEPRRLITTEVYVRGPDYVPVSVSIGIDVISGQNIATVREAVRQAVRSYLSPLTGGAQTNGTGPGWPLSKTVDPTGIMVQALLVPGVSNVRQVVLWDQTMTPISQLPLSGLQLPLLAQLNVTPNGDAQDLSAITAPPSKQRVAVPMVPPECC